ncbi:MAG: Asp-tRNA(Asn)/Glu-tRNA(Gln) amidotransferase subunit GatC [Thermodesulfobacteria bacterium]|nr:Asp-tRNA(Asn)/Glu-tRNA(Gln) amidotransferase subunit GatC [Thermodesulfobacteriota bacterium]
MGISLDEVYKIAHLSRLEFNEEEAKGLSEELSKILDYFKKLGEVNTEGVEPTFHAIRVATPFRDDEVKPFEDIDSILKNAPELKDRSIVVPKVVKAP